MKARRRMALWAAGISAYALLGLAGELLVRRELYIWEPMAGRVSGKDFTREPEAVAEWLKGYLAEEGLARAEGSSLRVRATAYGLVAELRDTAFNVDLAEYLLTRDQIAALQIEVETAFVAFAREDIEQLSARGSIRTEDLLAMRSQGRARLVEAPKVIVQNEMEATVKGVEEYIYPTDFKVGEYVHPHTNYWYVESIGGVEPSSFETREVGIILSVVPRVNGELIELTMTPEVVFPPLWRDYGFDVVPSGQEPSRRAMEQPFFHTHSLSTTVIARNGGVVLAGGGMPSRDGTEVVYVFVVARFVSPEGRYIRDPRSTETGGGVSR
jgi:hypothetical protein